jgi:hypothetical protein
MSQYYSAIFGLFSGKLSNNENFFAVVLTFLPLATIS